MKKNRVNRRQHDRYETDLKIQFLVNFDVETKIDYRVKDRPEADYSRQKYHAVSKNVSAEGLCFTSKRKLRRGDLILLEVFLPSASLPVAMEGAVRWSHLAERKSLSGETHYDTGVLLEKVGGEPVNASIFHDRKNGIIWSSVLESVFGSFKHLALTRKSHLHKSS